MTTDTSERGLERLICAALTGKPCDPPKPGEGAERDTLDPILDACVAVYR